MKPVVRFAPGPTGRIHIGNLRPALLNWLFEQHDGGTFLLRFGDTDPERSRGEYVEGIREDGLAFSSEVDTGSRRENATKQRARAPFRFNRNGKRL